MPRMGRTGKTKRPKKNGYWGKLPRNPKGLAPPEQDGATPPQNPPTLSPSEISERPKNPKWNPRRGPLESGLGTEGLGSVFNVQSSSRGRVGSYCTFSSKTRVTLRGPDLKTAQAPKGTG